MVSWPSTTSPQAFYVSTCKDMDLKVNQAFFNSLSPVPNDYDAVGVFPPLGVGMRVVV